VISAILFDFDGLLADTEPLHCQSWRAALAGHGVCVSEQFYLDWWVRQGKGIGDFLRSRGLKLDAQRLRDEKSVHYLRLVETSCAAMPGVRELLGRMSGRKKLAVASSGSADTIKAVLDKLGLTGHFATVVTSGDVQRVKPFPDVFLLAAQRLGVPPQQCLVLEDAEKGVLAARAAGMKCIAVPSPCTVDNDFSQADLVVGSLHEVTMDVIEAM
jgi:HAD superfamily hydrolase (TIGR01509 family)